MTKWKIYNEDAVEWAKNYQKGKFHALLTDAPYHLTSIVKRFGKNDSAPAKFGTDGVFQRSSSGFMGNTWDGGDLAFRPETWQAFGNVLHDGAFGMAFSASRNWHRMAVAIEDAGFILHPTIFLWVTGQGFPKATRVKGHEEFDGHRYGLQALKPAVEPIIVFQKPYSGKPVENIMQTGAGALNIDAARIPLATDDEYTINTFDDGAKPFGNGAGHKFTSRKIKEDKRLGGNGSWKTDKAAKNVYEGGYEGVDIASSPLGRWPSNLLLTEDSAEKLNAQTGNLLAGKATANSGAMGYHGGRRGSTPEMFYTDSGGASRFFYNVSTQIDEADPAYYCAKVSPKERNAGLDGMETTQREGASGNNRTRVCLSCELTDNGVNDHSDCGDMIENRIAQPTRNPHPTLKPIHLAKYLATLLLPPIEYAPRRIFIPFSGVASEMCGAGLAGWEHVVGVEFDKDNGYVDIAEKRMQYWMNK